MTRTAISSSQSDVLEIRTGEPTALSDVRAWCELTGNELVGAEVRDSGTRLLIRKARPRPARTVAGGSAELPGRAARRETSAGREREGPDGCE